MANNKWHTFGKLSTIIAKGFTLIELLVVIGIFSTLIGISSISLMNAQRQSSMTAAIQVFVADLKSQQLRAMTGEEDGAGNVADYGVHFETTSYTQFRGSYIQGNASNFKVDLPGNTQFFPINSDVVFAKGSGEIAGEVIVTIRDINDGSQRALTINKLGVIESVE